MRYQPQVYLTNQSPKFEDVHKSIPYSKPMYKEDIEMPHRPMIKRKFKRYMEPAVFLDHLQASEQVSEIPLIYTTGKTEEVVVKPFEEGE